MQVSNTCNYNKVMHLNKGIRKKCYHYECERDYAVHEMADTSPLSRLREPQVTSFSFLSAFEAFMAGAREPIHLRLILMPLIVHPQNLPFVHDIALPSRHQETRYLLEMHVHEEDVQSYICNKIYQSNTEKERVSN